MPSLELGGAEAKARRLRWAEGLDDVLSRYDTRLVLSVLILLSISPFDFVDQLWFVFATVFGVEAAARAYVLAVTPRKRASSRIGELGLLALDVLAWASFLPWAEATGLRFLRLIRFARLGLLVRYWGGTLRNVWHLLRREERARQIRLLLVGVVGMTFVSAALLNEMARARDPAELGLDRPAGFSDLVWWSVRQLNDPGNLVSDLDHLGIALLSLIMTISGIVLFSFLVGIGTSVVEDLMEASREQPMGYRQHSVLINAGEHATFLIDEVAEHVRKHLRKPRWMVLGRADLDAVFGSEPGYRHIHYRRGSPYHAEDLEKVDAVSARRFVVLGAPSLEEPDSDTMSALLSIRQVNPGATVFAEVFEEKHATAVLAAGGDRTIVVATQHLLAIVLANLVARPEYERVIEEMLTVRGSELYSYLYDDSERALVSSAGWPRGAHYGDFLAWAWAQHGCIPIGLASASRPRSARGPRDYAYVLEPSYGGGLPEAGDIRGVVGLSRSLDGLSAMARGYSTSSDQWRARGGEATPEVAGARPGGRAELPPCRLAERAARAERILLCRFVSRTPLLIEQLLRFLPGSTIYVMVDSASDRDRAERELESSGTSLARFGDPDRYDAAPRGRFEARGDGTFGYTDPDGQVVPGEVHLMVADWSSRTELLEARPNGYDPFTLDQVVIQTDPRDGGDPDARSVMALLKLSDLLRHPELGPRFERGLEIVAEIVDPLKARLLERRFSRAAGRRRTGRPGRVSVVTTEWLRHVLVFQATIVPGFGDLFYELFSQKGAALRRFLLELGPGDAGREVSFGDLLRHVYEVAGVTLVGYERIATRRGSAGIVLAPAPGESGSRVRLDEIGALYALGEVGADAEEFGPGDGPVSPEA